jgi:hypothetical protein
MTPTSAHILAEAPVSRSSVCVNGSVIKPALSQEVGEVCPVDSSVELVRWDG